MPLPGPGEPHEVRCPALAAGTGMPGVAELGPARPVRPVAAKAPQTSAIVARRRSFVGMFTLFCCVSGRATGAVRAQRWAKHMLSRLCCVGNAQWRRHLVGVCAAGPKSPVRTGYLTVMVTVLEARAV